MSTVDRWAALIEEIDQDLDGARGAEAWSAIAALSNAKRQAMAKLSDAEEAASSDLASTLTAADWKAVEDARKMAKMTPLEVSEVLAEGIAGWPLDAVAVIRRAVEARPVVELAAGAGG